MKKKNYNLKGHTIIELMVVAIVFSLFLLGITTVMDAGLKSWNMVDIKSEVQQETLITVKTLSRDLRLSDRPTAIIGGAGEEYAVFESPVAEGGIFKYDEETGYPEWQAYILYYTFPRNPVNPKAAMDKTLDINKNIKKYLICKKIKHTPASTPQILTNFEIYFTDPNSTPLMGEELDGNPRILSDHIFSMRIEENLLNSDAIDISLIMNKSILEDRLAYTKSFSDDKGVEEMNIKTTILLKNTDYY